APSPGKVDSTAGGWFMGDAVTEMSSIPTHLSLPPALAVIIRIWSNERSLAVEGSTTLTGVTRLERLGPVVASATNAGGTLVHVPVDPTRHWSATGCTALSVVSSISRRL